MLKYKKAIKAEIMNIVKANPAWGKAEILPAIMKYIKRLEPWEDRELEKYKGYSSEMIDNYLCALNEA